MGGVDFPLSAGRDRGQAEDGAADRQCVRLRRQSAGAGACGFTETIFKQHNESPSKLWPINAAPLISHLHPPPISLIFRLCAHCHPQPVAVAVPNRPKVEALARELGLTGMLAVFPNASGGGYICFQRFFS